MLQKYVRYYNKHLLEKFTFTRELVILYGIYLCKKFP